MKCPECDAKLPPRLHGPWYCDECGYEMAQIDDLVPVLEASIQKVKREKGLE